MRSLVHVSILGALLVFAAPASADSRPTSDDISLFSGRTVGNGDVVLAGGIGWPGVFAEALFAPTSRFNLSIRVDVDWGSPLMGFSTALGGQLSLPMRIHLYGEDDIDLALALRPFGMIGEGAMVGQEGVFSDDLGGGAGLEAGVRAGFHVSDAVTLATGAFFEGAFVRTRGAGSDGTFSFGLLGAVEAVMSRSTMLFFAVGGGFGIASGDLFERHGIVRLHLGLAYRI
ncbi:MAG: hypothetical protein H6724_11595 [Sandaracinus sp.]|nr:hypothetical protein [Sandaracinus sp.]MCB9625152.1 hypothetical protein [Sandaracinus sp.]